MEEEKSGNAAKKSIFSSLFAGTAEKKKLPVLLLLCGAVGVILLLWGGEFGGGGGGKTADPNDAKDAEAVSEAAKAELTELLAGVEGAGETKIYLTTATGADGEPKLLGVAVLCRGGNDPLVQKRIIGLLTALYDLGAHRIYVGELQPAA